MKSERESERPARARAKAREEGREIVKEIQGRRKEGSACGTCVSVSKVWKCEQPLPDYRSIA